MPIEIEKKFLLKYLPEELLLSPSSLSQGYITKKKEKVVRVRISDDSAFLTVKGPSKNAVRKEFEYRVPVEDAREMLELFCKNSLIIKKRYFIEYNGFEWVIDKFSGPNEGLVVAEIELEYEEQLFDLPDWIGEEVTGDARYYNSNLVEHPYTTWK